MRIRSTKPEFWRSTTIAALDWDVRLVLKGLESYVDDNGVGKDSVALICADVFPHDLATDPGTIARVSRAVAKLAEANLIVRYTVRSESLVYVRRWKLIQYIDKPKAGRYPRPDGSMNYRDEVDESIGAGQGITDQSVRDDYAKPREDFAKAPENSAPGTGEQGNRGSEEQAGGSGTEVCHQGANRVAPPPEKCPRHLNDENPPSCGACASRRRARDKWEREQAQAAGERAAAEAAEKAAAREIAKNCPWCSGTGIREIADDLVEKCDHKAPESGAA